MHLTRQQLCAKLQTSESTIRRMEHDGMPFIPVGKRGKRYNLAEVLEWSKRNRQCPSGSTTKIVEMSKFKLTADAYIASCQPGRLRVTPSKSKPDFEPN